MGANAASSAEALDRIGGLACRVLDVPVALVNLIGDDRQRFVGCSGPQPWASMGEMPLTAGFCPFALGADDAYALEDARVDPASAANPAVEQFGVVAYAGVPLRAANGEPIGTLCALDYEPRTWSEDDLALLTDLAAGVIAELSGPSPYCLSAQVTSDWESWGSASPMSGRSPARIASTWRRSAGSPRSRWRVHAPDGGPQPVR